MSETLNALLGFAVLLFLLQAVQLIWTVILVREVRKAFRQRRGY